MAASSHRRYAAAKAAILAATDASVARWYNLNLRSRTLKLRYFTPWDRRSKVNQKRAAANIALHEQLRDLADKVVVTRGGDCYIYHFNIAAKGAK